MGICDGILRGRIPVIALLAPVTILAASVNLSGTVFDQDARPRSGVVVSLDAAPLSDVTGEDGTWSISGDLTHLDAAKSRQVTGFPGFRWDGRRLELNSRGAAQLDAELFDAQGRCIASVAPRLLQAGYHNFTMVTSQLESGTYWLRVRLGNDRLVTAWAPGTVLTEQKKTPAPEATVTAGGQRLVYAVGGQIVAVDSLNSLKASGFRKWIRRIRLRGWVNADSRVKVESVVAWVSGDSLAVPQRILLSWDSLTSRYDGLLYLTSSPSHADVHRLWVEVLGNGGRCTGVSDTVTFRSRFDGVPAFSAANRIPVIAGLRDTAVEAGGGLVTLHAGIRSSGEIGKYEWSLNGAPFLAAGADFSFRPENRAVPHFPVILRVTDSRGNVALDTAWLKVWSRGMMTDARDGQTYRTVTIGTQTWMAQNLNYAVDSSWCYGNDSSRCAGDGRLYQWAAAMDLDAGYNAADWFGADSELHRGVCPAGWHLPTGLEWERLIRYVGGDSARVHLSAREGWNLGVSTDLYGFGVLPAGMRRPDGSFTARGEEAFFWPTSECAATGAWYQDFYVDYETVSSSGDRKTFARSVRCVMNPSQPKEDDELQILHLPKVRQRHHSDR